MFKTFPLYILSDLFNFILHTCCIIAALVICNITNTKNITKNHIEDVWLYNMKTLNSHLGSLKKLYFLGDSE